MVDLNTVASTFLPGYVLYLCRKRGKETSDRQRLGSTIVSREAGDN